MIVNYFIFLDLTTCFLRRKINLCKINHFIIMKTKVQRFINLSKVTQLVGWKQQEGKAGYFESCISRCSLHYSALLVIKISCFCGNIRHSHSFQTNTYESLGTLRIVNMKWKPIFKKIVFS